MGIANITLWVGMPTYAIADYSFEFILLVISLQILSSGSAHQKRIAYNG